MGGRAGAPRGPHLPGGRAGSEKSALPCLVVLTGAVYFKRPGLNKTFSVRTGPVAGRKIALQGGLVTNKPVYTRKDQATPRHGRRRLT